MTEKVIVRQNARYEASILATPLEGPDTDEYHPVEHILQLTPFGMLLASLGTCTTILLHSYAQNRNMQLDEVEIRLHYEEVSDPGDRYEEDIHETILLAGDLQQEERDRLFHISRQCAIHRLIEKGVAVHPHFSDKPIGADD
jgi:uncharacterized OsmC-like protein